MRPGDPRFLSGYISSQAAPEQVATQLLGSSPAPTGHLCQVVEGMKPCIQTGEPVSPKGLGARASGQPSSQPQSECFSLRWILSSGNWVLADNQAGAGNRLSHQGLFREEAFEKGRSQP